MELKFSKYIELVETKSVGSKQLYFIGTSESKLNDAALDREPGGGLLSLSRLSSDLAVDSAVFLTRNIEYAISYSQANSTADDLGIVFAVDLPKTCRFFDITDPDDYSMLFDETDNCKLLANIFKKCEPYFSLNTQLGSPQLNAKVPAEFKAASMILNRRSSRKDASLVDNVLNATTDFSPVKSDKYAAYWKECAIQTIKEMLTRAGMEKLQAKFDPDKSMTFDELICNVDIPDITSYSKTVNKNAFDANKTYIQTGFVVPTSDAIRKNQTLYSNYTSMYRADKTSAILDSSQIDAVNAYLFLFSQLGKYYNINIKNADQRFKNMVERLKTRIKAKSKSNTSAGVDDIGSHIYVDMLQLIFFSMIIEKGFYGIYAPEVKGYTGIHNDNIDCVFGYDPDHPRSDTTVILCREVSIVDYYWHRVGPLFKLPREQQYEFVNVVDRINTVSKYRRYFENIIEPHLEVNPVINRTNKLKRRSDRRLANHRFKISMTGTLYLVDRVTHEWSYDQSRRLTDFTLSSPAIGYDNVLSAIDKALAAGPQNNTQYMYGAILKKITAIDIDDNNREYDYPIPPNGYYSHVSAKYLR